MPSSNTLTQALGSVRLRYLESPVPAWLRAAGEALFEVLPRSLRRQLGVRNRRLLLSLQGDELQLHALSDEQTSLIGIVPTDDAGLLSELRLRLDEQAGNVGRWLMLGIRQTLRPVLVVPASAEARLREMMAHEIDRQTPFTLDQVSYEPRILSRDPLTRQLRVELVVLPRTTLEVALTQLGPMAVGLAGVDVVAADGRRLGVNLLPLAGRSARPDRARNLNRWLGAIAFAAIISSMLLVLDNRSETLRTTQARLVTVKARAIEARRLRNELRQSVQASSFLARQRAQQPTMLEVLADLSRRIPDSTWLEKISVNDGSIVLIGQSQQASALVGLLQPSPLVIRPTLTGSVQADPRTGKERFTLTAVMAGSAKEKEAANGDDNP